MAHHEGVGVQQVEARVLAHHLLARRDQEVLGGPQVPVELELLVGQQVQARPLPCLVQVPALVEVVLLVAQRGGVGVDAQVGVDHDLRLVELAPAICHIYYKQQIL